ncbi:hypothetical protein PAAG_00029 [Paracoccidioides lutzii Pb01]|uniref:Uncharacterized protein n=1 Tax=Paracoccidioides lutzii (strain ATCC MYA-826 / Pb01) TaxID=502779 RepID=C1GND4_PARBA|nr:hypothetical protein PAAG_00029 [Paracoccidioides lutzii Pb01]EEH35706.2 hypothetical protein PAAG_00029 [Paracoccidioides lutzii Pb01]
MEVNKPEVHLLNVRTFFVLTKMLDDEPGQSSIDEGNHLVLVKCQFTDKGEDGEVPEHFVDPWQWNNLLRRFTRAPVPVGLENGKQQNQMLNGIRTAKQGRRYGVAGRKGQQFFVGHLQATDYSPPRPAKFRTSFGRARIGRNLEHWGD